MSLELQVTNLYTFNTFAPALLGAVIENARLLAICDFGTAMKFENVQAKYEQIYPVLPPGSPRSSQSVVYYFFQYSKYDTDPNSSTYLSTVTLKVMIAENWIDGTSLIGKPHQNFTIDVLNTTVETRQDVKTTLSHLNINFAINDGVSLATPVSSMDINSTYTFDNYVPAVLGDTISNAILQGSFSYGYAQRLEDVGGKYQQIYPSLVNTYAALGLTPPPSSPTGIIFHQFLTESGELVIYADNWINKGTMSDVQNINFTIEVVNATASDRKAILSVLGNLGLTYQAH